MGWGRGDDFTFLVGIIFNIPLQNAARTVGIFQTVNFVLSNS